MKGVFTMLVRNCAGGVVFHGDKVLLLKNEKSEWVLPKGVIRNGEIPSEVALRRVKEEAGVTAEIISTAGRTNYEFYSVTRQKPVCNKIIWYVMKSPDENCSLNKDYEFTEVGFYDIEKALEMVTYSQDRSLINVSYLKIKEYEEEGDNISSNMVSI